MGYNTMGYSSRKERAHEGENGGKSWLPSNSTSDRLADQVGFWPNQNDISPQDAARGKQRCSTPPGAVPGPDPGLLLFLVSSKSPTERSRDLFVGPFLFSGLFFAMEFDIIYLMSEKEKTIIKEAVQSFQTERGLIDYLRNFNISVETWGQGSAKTVGHLLKEIEQGEMALVPLGKELVRQVEIASVDVYFQDGNDRYRLVEDRQEFKDGRVRRRSPRGSLSEKMKSGENSSEVAKRAVVEELGIESEVQVSEGEIIEELEDSLSYPGLKAQYVLHVFSVELDQDQFSADGYREDQEDKTTYFIWRKIS
ncbi:MAG: hypothetical protein Q7S32_01010 [bacterium]|nr:hypothetical protein [bacterium]